MLAPAGAPAAEGDVGYQGPSSYGASSGPSGSKPESKLWWNDGYWWGSIFDTASRDFHIFKLDPLTQAWNDTGVTLDPRTNSRADTLWDGTHLYVASHVSSTSPAAGYPARLYRYSYDSGTDTYSPDRGFPVSISNHRTETLVIDKDSTGKLWATWVQDQKVYVNRTVAGDANWGTPFVLPVEGTTVTGDDISSLVAFEGNRIGVMWSNQSASGTGFYFAAHVDGAADATWEVSRAAVQGPGSADDHINLKSDRSGRVFAAIKTSYEAGTDPLVMLLVRDPGTGQWASHVVGVEDDEHTRPIVLLDETAGVVYVLATGPPCCTGGDILLKSSPIDSVAFSPGLGTVFIRDAASTRLNNVTSTKQSLGPTTGLVALATNDATRSYWHNNRSLGQAPPTADFAASPREGPPPLSVQFTDTSIGGPTSWAWDLDGDGSVDSTAQNPQFTYPGEGTYTVTLTAANAAGSDTETKVGYVRVASTATVTLSPLADARVEEAYPDKNFGASSALRLDGGTDPDMESYLQFTVSGLWGPVRSAKLRLYATTDTRDGPAAYSTGTGWSESGLTWSNRPARASGPHDDKGAIPANSWVEFDVTPLVTGDGTYSFLLATTSTDGISFYSREGAQKPQLVVTYG